MSDMHQIGMPLLFWNRIPDTGMLVDIATEGLWGEVASSFLAEGALSYNLSDQERKIPVVGSVLGNAIDTIVSAPGSWNPATWFFRLPILEHEPFLWSYQNWYQGTNPQISLGWLFSEFLPGHYPFCRKVLMRFHRGVAMDPNSAPVVGGYDDVERTFEIDVCALPNENLLDLAQDSQYTRADEFMRPGKAGSTGETDEDYNPTWLKEGNTLIWELKKACRRKVQLPSMLEHEVESLSTKRVGQFIYRLRHLASMLTSDESPNASAVGFPLNAALKDRSDFVGVLWLLYQANWDDIQKTEVPRLEHLERIIAAPLALRLQSCLLCRQSLLRNTAEVRAAAAAILARNMSHNIGSHVTPRTKLDDLKRRVRELLIQDDWWDGGDWNYKAFPIIEGMKDRLDEYIQRKAEFIAEFSTDPLFSTRSAWFFKEVLQSLIDNTALMDTLAANEGFTYKDYRTSRLAIRCWYATKNGERQKIKATYCSDWVPDEELDWPEEMLGAPYAMRHIDFATKELYSKTSKDVPDVRVSLPGPVGDMAVYSILENVIRNAAKHGSKSRGGTANDRKQLVVNVLIDEGGITEPNCKVTVWDNLSDPQKPIKEKPLHEKMRELVGMDIIDADGQLRKEAWGTAEMVLGANLLQGHPPGVARSSPCLEVLGLDHSEDDNGKCLTYRFEIPKARTAVFFGWDSDEIAKDQEETLASAGFLLRSIDELTAHTETMLPACDFAVINAENLSASDRTAIFYAQRHRIPFRIIFVGAPEFDDAMNDDCLKKRVARTDCPPEWKESPQVTSWLWETWISHLRTGEPVGSDIYLQQKSTEQPTKEWIDQANTYNGEIDGEGFSSHDAPLRVWAHGEKNRIECYTKAKGVRPNERRVVADRHGNLVHETGVGSQENDRSIIIDKSSTDFDALFNPSFAQQPWTVPYELAEAGLLRVLVVDERIVQGALRDFEEMGAGKDAFRLAFTGNTQLPATAWHVARKAGVHVATHLVLKPAANTKDQDHIFTIASRDWTQTVPSSGSPWTEISIDYSLTNNALRVDKVTFANQYKDRIDPDLVVVHQGVADCLNDKVDGLGKEFLEVVSKNHWLIVESGRGIPPEVEETRHKFLTFSAIERAFRNGRMAKLALTRVTMSATRHKVGGAHE